MDETQRDVMAAVAQATIQGGGVRSRCSQLNDEEYTRTIKNLGEQGYLHTGRIRPELTPLGWEWVNQSTPSTPGLPASDPVTV